MTPTWTPANGLKETLDGLVGRRTVLRGCLFLMLDESPGHGYDLIGRVVPLGVERSNPGKVYRALHWMEIHDLIVAAWDTTAGDGPARRVFGLTDHGREVLEQHGADMLRAVRQLEGPVAKYVHRQLAKRIRDKEAFPLQVTIDLRVSAADEAAAERKVRRCFAPDTRVGDDLVAVAVRRVAPVR